MRFQENIPIAESYLDAFLLFRTDVYRLYGGGKSIRKIPSLIFNNRCLRFLFFFRMAQFQGWAHPIFIRISNHYAEKYALMIYPETRIGYGLYLGHGFNTIVNASAVIGNNVNLSHGVTIGANTTKAAIIGDSVYIGPNVCTVRDCTIGTGATIGAGSVVTRDIPDYVTAVGSPARPIGPSHPEYIGNPLSMDEFERMIR